MTRKVQVLVVDDSPLCRQLIADALALDPDIEVIGTAENGEDAIAKVQALKPQVVTMDVDMPVLDGLSATERIMGETPVPILVLTADPQNQAPELTHRALAVGALALQVKPPLDAGLEAWNLAREVKLLSTVKVIRHLRGVKKVSVTGTYAPITPADLTPFSVNPPFGVVTIVGSTGGPQVLQKLMSDLPADFPVPIAIVQHINSAFADSLVGWLQAASKLKVRAAKDGDLLTPGSVFIAPSGAHLTIATRGRLAVKPGEQRDGHIPSGTSLMESAAKAYGRRTLGVILTGMGADGADGMLAIHQAQGRTIAQNQESCVVFGMPGAAVSKGAVDHLVHGDEIASAMVKLTKGFDLPHLTNS